MSASLGMFTPGDSADWVMKMRYWDEVTDVAWSYDIYFIMQVLVVTLIQHCR